MQDSPLWTGQSFRNLHPALPVLRDPLVASPTISEFLCGGTRRTPRGPLPSLDPRDAWLKKPGTGLTTEYATIRERLGPFDLIMLDVGAFHPSWGDIHLGPANALEAHALLGGGTFLPVHWGTFTLAMRAWDEPAETLVSLGAKRSARLVMPRLGEPVEPVRVESVTPWWRSVDTQPVTVAALEKPVLESLPKSMPWPID